MGGPLSHTVDFQSARDDVRRAKRALKDAELRFDTECGPENSISLMNEIGRRRSASSRPFPC